MATNLVKFCTAALAGSIIGIAYERWSSPLPPWISGPPNLFSTALASSSLVPKQPENNLKPRLDSFDLNPKVAGENLKESSKYGLPSKDNIRLFNDFILSYDRRLRAPAWVIEHLTPEKLDKRDESIHRGKSNFKEDKTIHEYFRAQNSDFSGTGFDRGHMAAAGNHKLDQDDLDQTFILSNISPQVPEFNRGGWERLETYVRYIAKRSKNLYVVTGPLYLPLKARNGNLYVTYQVIGKNHVSVPTHYFKVVLYESNDNRLFMEAFLMPNDPSVDERARLDEYRIPIEKIDTIERASGVIFFDQLQRNKIEAPRTLPTDFVDNPRSSRRENRKNPPLPN